MRNQLLTILLVMLLPLVSLAQNSDLTPMEELGKELFFDKIASPDNMSCADCHGPNVGFTGPIPGFNAHGAVYPGAVPQRFGNRKPPSAAYATFSPVFHFDPVEGLFVGGNFWDGRATGEVLGNPAADQALGPFLNPVEQNNASKQAVLEQIAGSNYAWLWEVVWGTPISYDTPMDIDQNYNRVGLAIAAYEASPEVNPFTSKFDYYLQGEVSLSNEELEGMVLFNSKGRCAECHISTSETPGVPPLFTDFTFDNLGVPKNLENPFYDMDQVFLDDGSPINPLGADWIDPGLGGFLENHPNPAFQAMADENMGKHKVPTLRNVDKRPGNGFKKAYMHNGVFKSLKEVVHFYNTRDVAFWPDPEVEENVNDSELGNLLLTDDEEDAIVAFMKTLSDGYKLPNKSLAVESTVRTDHLELNLLGANPFREVLRLEYNLPEESSVQISIFSIGGERVYTETPGLQASGNYQVAIRPGDIGSGIYIVHLRAGEQTIARKVSLMK